MAYVGQWTLMGLGCIVGQDLVQRSLASKNETVARQSAITAGVSYMLIGTIPITLGLAGRLILPGLEDPELVMPNLAMRFLPPVALMMFLGALISAIMSSADNSLLAATSLMTNNIILRVFPHVGKRDILPLLRITTVVMAIISMGVALYVKQIYRLMVNSWATLFVGIFIPVTAALYWKKANKPACWVSMIGGTLTWIGYILLKTGNLQEISDPIFYRAAAYGGLASLSGYIIVTFLRLKLFSRGESR